MVPGAMGEAPKWKLDTIADYLARPAHQRIAKLQTYFQASVPHYWIIDPVAGSNEVFRRLDLADALVQTALRGERVRAEPFEAVELRVDELLGADPED
jgi:Uma2 family endonuclease